MRKALSILAFFLAACASGSSVDLDTSNTQIELDVYSGLPNPVWPLTTQEANQLEARLTGLPDGEGAIPDHLGYRGFLIRPLGARVYGGIVVLDGKVYRDVKGAESWLLDYAERRGQTVRR